MSDACEMPGNNSAPEQVAAILRSARSIAVVGLSDKPDRDSYHVAAYMQRAGYRIVPVNPAVAEVLGVKSVPSLRDLSEPVDVVNIFRKPEAVPAIVEDAIALGARVVWMQQGVVHNEAARRARDAGLEVVMDRCLMREHLERADNQM